MNGGIVFIDPDDQGAARKGDPAKHQRFIADMNPHPRIEEIAENSRKFIRVTSDEVGHLRNASAANLASRYRVEPVGILFSAELNGIADDLHLPLGSETFGPPGQGQRPGRHIVDLVIQPVKMTCELTLNKIFPHVGMPIQESSRQASGRLLERHMVAANGNGNLARGPLQHSTGLDEKRLPDSMNLDTVSLQ